MCSLRNAWGFHQGFNFQGCPRNTSFVVVGCFVGSKLFKKKSLVRITLYLRSNVHQGDELFSSQSRGKQCAFMSLSAVITAHNKPLFNWSKTTFDNVLLQGDKMYLKALTRGLITSDPEVEFLTKVVSVTSCKNELSYDICGSVIPPDVQTQNCNNEQIKNNICLPVVVEFVEAQNKTDLPIVVEPIAAQNSIDLPIEVENNDDLPKAAKNESHIWITNYEKELQGLIITDQEIEPHYYDIHTALVNTFVNHSGYTILILGGFIMALIKQMESFYSIDFACTWP